MSSLDEFLAEAERRRVDQAPAGALARLVEGLRLPSELIESHVRFDPAGYHRSLVRRTDALDLLILSWMPGQRSTVHDHAGSRGVVRVHRGVLTSRSFAVEGPAARSTGETLVPAPGLAAVEVGDVHQLANTSAGPLVTVHVYAPPLQGMNAYRAA